MKRSKNPEGDPFFYAAKPRSNTRLGRVYANRGFDHAPIFPDEEIEALRREHRSRRVSLRDAHRELEAAIRSKEQNPQLIKALGESYTRLSSRQGAVRKALDSISFHPDPKQRPATKVQPEVLVVDQSNHGIGLTTTRPIIRTENPDSLVIGGMTAFDGKHALFMTNQQRPENNFQALSDELDLRERGGVMVVFSPGSNQETAHFQQLVKLIGQLQAGFPNFNLYHQLYLPDQNTPNPHAQIDIRSMVASSNAGSVRLDRPHRML